MKSIRNGIKAISIAITLNVGFSHAAYNAIIIPSEYYSTKAKVDPIYWYGFFETDCATGTTKNLNNLNSWENASYRIICNGDSEYLPNVSELKKISTELRIGSPTKFYKTNSLFGLKGLNNIHDDLDLYLQGEGIEFNKLENLGNVKLYLNHEGLKNINIKGLKKHQLQILGDETNKSKVNQIIFDAAMYGYLDHNILMKNIKDVNIKTTPDSSSATVYVHESNVNTVLMEKSTDIKKDKPDLKTNYSHFRFKNSTIKNIIADKINYLHLAHIYLSERAGSESFNTINSFLINKSYLGHINFENIKSLSKLNIKNSLFTNSQFYIVSENGNINDGIYIENDFYNENEDVIFSITDFDKINNINISNIGFSNSTINFVANNEIKKIELNNFSSSNVLFKASKIEEFISNVDNTISMENKNYNFEGNVNKVIFNHENLPNIFFYGNVEDLLINNIVKSSKIEFNGNVKSLIINTAEELEDFQIDFFGDISNIEFNDNNSENKIDNILFKIDTTKILNHDVLKTLETGTIKIKNIYDGAFQQPFSNKFESTSPFCLNYGTKIKLYTHNELAGVVPKSSICE